MTVKTGETEHVVRVRLRAEFEVEMRIKVADGDEPSDLTREEARRAQSMCPGSTLGLL